VRRRHGNRPAHRISDFRALLYHQSPWRGHRLGPLHLAKPFTLDALARKLREILA